MFPMHDAPDPKRMKQDIRPLGDGRVIEGATKLLMEDAEKRFPEPPKSAKELKRQVREDMRRAAMTRKLLRALPRKPGARIPDEVYKYVWENASRNAYQTYRYLDFEKNIAAFKYRSNIRMSDKELADHIAKNQAAICSIVREYEIMLAWMVFADHLKTYEAFNAKIMDRVREEEEKAKAKQADEFAAVDAEAKRREEDRRAKARETFK